MKTGIELITEERERQISQEGWTPEHDDKHKRAELSGAAACYAIAANELASPSPYINKPDVSLWPWSMDWWKPKNDPVKCLVKAGALIAAEIDRLHRKQNKNPCPLMTCDKCGNRQTFSSKFLNTADVAEGFCDGCHSQTTWHLSVNSNSTVIGTGFYREAKPGTFGSSEWLDLLTACQDGRATCMRALEIIEREMDLIRNPPKHIYWGAGEPDCPKEIKAPNGELHTLKCKVCGVENPKGICLTTLANVKDQAQPKDQNQPSNT